MNGFNGNYGNVTGKDHVGGVIGENTTDITGVNAENAGTVIATGGGAGGIFGIHTGNLTNSTLKNVGTVIGTGDGGTGGLIGQNTGNINKSSLKNEADAIVIGINNVGGLIGINTGTIEGGRDDNNSYYKYQIYNNGVINVGTWNDTNNDGVVDTGEITSTSGSNIGGLIGSNEANGSLTAGYNTGAINAGNSSNVGGIVGNNVGTVDQVFNTVFNSDGTNGTITGGTNVGGIIGSNSGTLTNAYNTTAVNGAADSTGSIVGNNSNSIKYVYGSSSLVGTGNGTLEYSYEINTDEKWNNAGSYEGFAFSDGKYDKQNGIWKIYEGYGHPLLKVFLTSANYDSTSDTSFVYNGKEQGLNAGNVIAADGLGAYNNAEQLLQALLT